MTKTEVEAKILGAVLYGRRYYITQLAVYAGLGYPFRPHAYNRRREQQHARRLLPHLRRLERRGLLGVSRGLQGPGPTTRPASLYAWWWWLTDYGQVEQARLAQAALGERFVDAIRPTLDLIRPLLEHP